MNQQLPTPLAFDSIASISGPLDLFEDDLRALIQSEARTPKSLWSGGPACSDSHLHHLVDAPIVYSVPSGDDYPGEERLDERRFRLADVGRRGKASFIYEYDFGDSWAHEVVVEKTLPADPKKKYAVCLDGKNACPPEDCGGIWGDARLARWPV